jgi:hypothetical protein
MSLAETTASTDYPDSAASVNIGAISYRARCTEAGCKNLRRRMMIYADAGAGRLLTRWFAISTPQEAVARPVRGAQDLRRSRGF